MKRIMIIDERKLIGYAGGAEHIICDLANEMLNRGYYVDMVCMESQKGRPWYYLDENVQIINLNYEYCTSRYNGAGWQLKKLKREVLRALGGPKLVIAGKQYADPKKEYFFNEFINRLKLCLAEKKTDVIIAISEDSAYIAQQAKKKIEDIPVIAMCHSNPANYIQDMQEYQLNALKDSTFVQVLMESFKPILNKAGVDRIIAIPNVVKQFSDSELVNLNECKNTIITAGRLEGNGKRQHLLIEAFARIADRYPEWKLDIYGEADNKRYPQKLEKLIKQYGLESRVQLRGLTDKLHDQMRKSDIFAFSSRDEGFGLALAEAMSIGLPVIAYKSCYPTDELVQDGKEGLLASDDVDDFADKLSKLISDADLRMSLGKNGHVKAAQFSGTVIWDKWENVIKQAMQVI